MREKWGGIQNSTQTPNCNFTDTMPLKIPISQVSSELLRNYYEVQKMSTKEMAKRLETSSSVIQKYLEEYGIKPRPVGSNVKRKRGVAYGQKIIRGQAQVLLKERENIEKMQELRANGFSYWKIAEIFNSMKIPTKTKKGKWHAKTICSILTQRNNSNSEKGLGSSLLFGSSITSSKPGK